jgi:hypothetical protein
MHSSTVDSLHKKGGISDIGIGGWKCSCCAFPKRYIKEYKRFAKHRAKRENEKFDKLAEGE